MHLYDFAIPGHAIPSSALLYGYAIRMLSNTGRQLADGLDQRTGIRAYLGVAERLRSNTDADGSYGFPAQVRHRQPVRLSSAPRVTT
ncbi:hypothetical protein BI343_16085 [Chromobacterium amazonense]|nr:hypothetical protein BI343_16085 [Chromobacterium amazonense]